MQESKKIPKAAAGWRPAAKNDFVKRSLKLVHNNSVDFFSSITEIAREKFFTRYINGKVLIECLNK